MAILEPKGVVTIKAPTTIAVVGNSLSKKVTVKTSASTVDVVPGQLLILDDKTSKAYTAAAVSTDYATTAPTNRCVVALEAATATTTGVEITVCYSGQVYTAAVREAGHSAENVPDYILDKLGGLSNITFINEQMA